MKNSEIIRRELTIEMIAECNLQIKNIEHTRDTQYSDDPEQVQAFNNQIKYHEFMASRLEGYEKRLKAGITLS